MLENASVGELSRYVGHEVLDANGESVGFVDLLFTDTDTGRPEWLGVWNGVWDTRPRVLVPLRGVRPEGEAVRLPWTKDTVEAAPTYEDEDDRGVLADDPDGIAISPEKEERAYAHYGVEPAGATPETATPAQEPGRPRIVRFRAIRLETRAPGARRP